jgi:zinc and cadmium transporter
MVIIPLFLLAFLGSFAGLAGGLLLLWKENLAKKFSIYLISFAAGVILSATFVDLLPEAVHEGGEGVFVLMLIGLVAFFLIEDLFLHFHHHEKHEHSLKSAVPLIVFSDTVHNFIDGIVISVSFLANPNLGFIVALATFFHEIPQEIGDFGVLISAKLSKIKVLGANILSSFATFLGVGLTVLLSEKLANLIGPLLGLACGMFLYIALVDILPELVKTEKNKDKIKIAGSFLFGVVLMVLLSSILPH